MPRTPEWQSDGWFARVSDAERARIRRWVRWRLLADPSASDADIDRLVAWMPEPMFEELRRRAAAWASPVGLSRVPWLPR